MSVYDIDIDALIWQVIPTQWRDPVLYEWWKCLAAPTKYLNGKFLANRASNLYNLAHTGQVCYLQAAINDVFDPTLRRIMVTDAPKDASVYLYLDDEEKPVPLYLDSESSPVILYTDAELADSTPDFLVVVPSAVAALPIYNEVRMKAVVDLYRLAGKSNYSIVIS